MTPINLVNAINPVREICDFFHIYPAWQYRMENVHHTGSALHSLDLVHTVGQVNKVIHIQHVDGIGLTISDVEECLTIS